MISLHQFWDEENEWHPPLTAEMLAAAEAQLGVTLPAEYVRLLRVQNGGYTRGFAFPMPQGTSWAEDHIPLDELFGIITDPTLETSQNILETAYMTQEWGLPPRQVILAGDGHWWITLDYRDGEVPAVAWIDVECDQDLQAAPTFSAFLEGLVPASKLDE